MGIMTHCIVDGNNVYPIEDATSIFKFNPILDELINREVRCDIKTTSNGMISGVFKIQKQDDIKVPHDDARMSRIKLSSRTCKLYYTLSDIWKCRKFKIIILEVNKNDVT